MVPRSSDRISRVPPYLMRPIKLPIRGCHPLWLCFPSHSGRSQGSAGPRSLATTKGVSVDFLSSGYLDVSVPRVRFLNPMCSGPRYLVCPTVHCPKEQTTAKHQVGFPIQRSMDQSLFPAPHGLSQGITSFIASCCQGIHQTPLSRLIRSGRRKTQGHPARGVPGAPFCVCAPSLPHHACILIPPSQTRGLG